MPRSGWRPGSVVVTSRKDGRGSDPGSVGDRSWLDRYPLTDQGDESPGASGPKTHPRNRGGVRTFAPGPSYSYRTRGVWNRGPSLSSHCPTEGPDTSRSARGAEVEDTTQHSSWSVVVSCPGTPRCTRSTTSRLR